MLFPVILRTDLLTPWICRGHRQKNCGNVKRGLTLYAQPPLNGLCRYCACLRPRLSAMASAVFWLTAFTPPTTYALLTLPL